jgi:N-acetylmuramoyl-L-alanine amidase
MARTIYHEARGSTEENQLAVALVVMNRQKLTQQTICQVIHAPGQFQWTAHGRGHLAERAAWVRSQRVAYLVMFTEGVEDITMGSTHFHEPAVQPNWSRRASQSMLIGAHVFHRIPRYEEVAQAR